MTFPPCQNHTTTKNVFCQQPERVGSRLFSDIPDQSPVQLTSSSLRRNQAENLTKPAWTSDLQNYQLMNLWFILNHCICGNQLCRNRKQDIQYSRQYGSRHLYNGHIDQCNRTMNSEINSIYSEINSSNYGKLFPTKMLMQFIGEKITFSADIDRTIGHLQKR